MLLDRSEHFPAELQACVYVCVWLVGQDEARARACIALSWAWVVVRIDGSLPIHPKVAGKGMHAGGSH